MIETWPTPVNVAGVASGIAGQERCHVGLVDVVIRYVGISAELAMRRRLATGAVLGLAAHQFGSGRVRRLHGDPDRPGVFSASPARFAAAESDVAVCGVHLRLRDGPPDRCGAVLLAAYRLSGLV